MKLIKDFLNSGTVQQQNRKKLGALLICITAALLVVALIVLTVAAIAGAIKDKNRENEEDDAGVKIPNGYVTKTLEEGTSSNGTLLQIDEEHLYVGTATTVQPDGSVRAKTEDGKDIYKGAYGDINITQETLDAFNEMMLAFHEAKGNSEEYRVGSVWLASLLNGLNSEITPATKEAFKTGCVLVLEDQYEEEAPSIYDAERKTGKGVYKWIYDNAAKFGFVRISDSDAEGNIFRYVGAAHATYMANRGFTVEEYLNYLREKTSVRSQLNVSVTGSDGKAIRYGVYYIAADAAEQYVPEDDAFYYTVSGDNLGGYIVTVDKTTKVVVTDDTVEAA